MAVLALGGIVASRSLRIAGDEMNDDIIRYARERFNLLLGERTAEDLKIKIGSAYLGDTLTAPMRGRDFVTGLPKEIMVTSDHLAEAMAKSVGTIVDEIKATVEETPPELVADIMDHGVVLAGGGALLRGLNRRVVVRGTGLVLEDLDTLKEVLLPPVAARARL